MTHVVDYRGNGAVLADEVVWDGTTTTATAAPSFLSDTPPRRIQLRLQQGTVLLLLKVPEPKWLYPTLQVMKEFSALLANWDSYGSRRIDDLAIYHAVKFLLMVVGAKDGPVPIVVPTSRGGIQLEWHAIGADLEVEFSPKSGASAIFFNRTANEVWEANDTDADFLAGVRDALGRV